MKHKTESSRFKYNRQQNLCISLLTKSKASYFQYLDSKVARDNEKFWKSVSSLFSNKEKSEEKIALVGNNEIISDEAEIAKIFKNFFDKIVGNLDINQNLSFVRESIKNYSVLESIEKNSIHSSIKNIKSRKFQISLLKMLIKINFLKKVRWK